MSLLLMLAIAHIRGRVRQMLVAGFGVALGVGFSIAMAALMQGSQDDFIRQLVDTIPHVEITDELRAPVVQPAEGAFAAAQFFGLRPREDSRGIRNPSAVQAALRAWVPGNIAPALRTQAVVRFPGREAGVALHGVAPEDEAAVSSIARDFTLGSFSALAAGGNNIVIGRSLAEKLGAAAGSTVSLATAMAGGATSGSWGSFTPEPARATRARSTWPSRRRRRCRGGRTRSTRSASGLTIPQARAGRAARPRP